MRRGWKNAAVLLLAVCVVASAAQTPTRISSRLAVPAKDAGLVTADGAKEADVVHSDADGSRHPMESSKQAANYARPVEPVVKSALLPLPPGAVEPVGWLRDWAEAARHGITGHLDKWHPTFADGWKGVPIKAPGAKPDGAGFGLPSFCTDRHGRTTNVMFLDWSVRSVGLKELFTLQWSKEFVTAGRFTKAGGAEPDDWPSWMKDCTDY